MREDVPKKASTLNFQAMLKNALEMRPGVSILGGSIGQDFELEKRLDQELIMKSLDVIEGREKTVDIDMVIRNEQRTFGATLSNKVSLSCGVEGLPDNSINVKLTGSAGQSFCAFLMKGISVTLAGDANDYVGKGLSGGKVVIFPPKEIADDFKSEKNIIVGNVCLYGATSGKAFFRGMGAERFCVRNSGVTAVIEGCGDHGCEYMTGGRVIVLGSTGRNFAAGMSGGIAYILDRDGRFESRCNQTMVDLLPVEAEEDKNFLKSTLTEFVEETGSTVARKLLEDWPGSLTKMVKVFPHEYQRALQEQKLEEEVEIKKAAEKNILSPSLDIRNAYDIDNTPAVPGLSHVVLPAEALEPDCDSEDEDEMSPVSSTLRQPPRLMKIPVKQLAPPTIKIINNNNDMKNGDSNGVSEKGDAENGSQDIEDTVADVVMKKKKRETFLDKTRGFVKYKRETKLYRDPEERQGDWDEIFDFKSVRRGLKTQAAR